jgi:prolyl oligopeptidase PreP (S9A serine peptidase family)
MEKVNNLELCLCSIISNWLFSGVFYGRFPVQDDNADGRETNTNENQKVYYHRLGESQDKDILVAEFVDQPNWRFSVDVSDCGSYLVLNIMYGCNDSLLYFARLGSDIFGKLDFTKVVTGKKIENKHLNKLYFSFFHYRIQRRL